MWDPAAWLAELGGSLLARSEGNDARAVGLALLHRVAENEAGIGGRAESTRAAIAAGDVDLARRPAPDPEGLEAPWLRASANAAAAAVAEAEARWAEAVARYTTSLALWEELGYPNKLPVEKIGLGRCLIHVGRTEEAIAILRAARVTCEALGAYIRIAEIDRLVADARQAPA